MTRRTGRSVAQRREAGLPTTWRQRAGLRRAGWPIPLLVALVLAGCAAVGPDHVRPSAEVPAAFGEGQGWKRAATDARPEPDWWRVYGDAQLDALASAVAPGNQDVAGFAAAVRQAQAALAAARAPQGPSVTAAASGSRGRNASVSATSAVSASAPVTEIYRESVSASWELDLWGRIRRSVEAGEASLRASEADLRGALLAAQATLVQSYLQLRVNEAQQRLLADTVSAYERFLSITRNRYEAGVAPRSDLSQAQTQLLGARAQRVDLGAQRAQLAHAIAVLTGRPPSALPVPVGAALPALPQVPSVLPSELLERRPDIAAAERRVAAANAQIGVAQAAFFPTISLGTTAGIASGSVSNLASLPFRFWSLGPSLAATLFDNGLRRSQRAQATAAWERTVAQYRAAVLGAFQEVEDALSTLRILDEEAQVQADVVESARETLALTENQYLAGTVSFLNVTTAQATLLAAQRAALDLHARRLVASVALMRATGGLR